MFFTCLWGNLEGDTQISDKQKEAKSTGDAFVEIQKQMVSPYEVEENQVKYASEGALRGYKNISSLKNILDVDTRLRKRLKLVLRPVSA